MAKGMSMKVLLQLQTKEFQKGINSIKKQLTGLQNFVKSAFALGSITMFGRQMVQVSKDFEDAMARVQSVSNATSSEFKKMREEAERLGSSTRYTASEAASALENLTRNGMTAAQATKSLSDVLAMAQANNIALARSADIMTNSLNMFGLSVDSAAKVSDILSSTASHAATDIDNLYEALVNAAPAAKVLGFSLEETSAAIGALAQRGVKGSEAGTKLRIALQKMADPKVVAKMKAQGIEIDETTIKAEGLYKTIEKLAKANLSLGQLGSIFDAKSAMAIQLMVSSMSDLNYMLGVTANSAGETSRMMNQSVGSVQKELDTLKSKYEGLLISIGNQTKGVVKSTIKLLQNLIGNFETVGGTIMNIASVAVPLLTKRVITLGSSLRTMFTQAAAGAATMKAAMGGIVTIVATLVTWVGTALVGAWNKAHKAMRDANAQMARVEKESADTQRALEKIKEEIGDGSNENSVNGAVAKAIKLFPEFADAIRNAAAVARQTGDWEKLKSVLQDIAELQNLVSKKEAKSALARAQAQKLGNKWYEMGGWGNNAINHRNGPQRGFSDRKGAQQTARTIRQSLKESGFDKESVKEIFVQMAEMANSTGNILENLHDVVELLRDYGVTPEAISDDDLMNGLISLSGSRAGDFMAGRETNKEIRQLDSTVVSKKAEGFLQDFLNKETLFLKELSDKEITRKEFAQKMYEAGQDMLQSAYELGEVPDELLDKMKAEAARYKKPKTNPGGGGGDSSTSKAKTATDLVKDALDDYKESAQKLQNRLNAGTITTEDYEKELKNLVDKTWETITAISNFEGILAKLGETATGADLGNRYKENRTAESNKALDEQYAKLFSLVKLPQKDNREQTGKTETEAIEKKYKISFDYAEALSGMVRDLETAIENGDFELVRGDAIAMLEKLREAAKKASDEADNLQDKLNLSEAITKLDEEIKSLSTSSFNTFNTLADVFDRLSSSLMSIAQVFDEDLQDSPFFKAFQAFNSVLNSSIQIMEAVMSVIELRKQLENKAAMEKMKNTAMEVAANELATESEIKKTAAAAGAAAAGGAASVASIPYIGPALAVAAVASITAAILAGMAKFANGGYVKGSSTSGDNNIIRANAGELVLNPAQQRNLLALANGQATPNGKSQVEFKIRGADLVGTLNNYNRLRNS